MAERNGMDGKVPTGDRARVAGNADRDAQADAPPGGVAASSGKADPAREGHGVGTGGAPIPGIGEEHRTDAAAGPGADGTVLPGNMNRPGRPNATET